MKTNPFIRLMIVLSITFGPYLIGWCIIPQSPREDVWIKVLDVIMNWTIGALSAVLAFCAYMAFKAIYNYVMTGRP